tara:strand:- start:778 stop:1089 length:312 start_codon:yes stop_codon:yes gene_type:complete
MNTVTIKIIAWEDNGQSLICKYASDETASSNPDDYNAIAFQPASMWPDATTSDEVLKAAARAGVSVCEEIKKQEDLSNDSEKINFYNGLVDTQQTFNVTDLTE